MKICLIKVERFEYPVIKDNWKIKVNGKGMSANDIYERLKKSRNIDKISDFFHPSTYHILPYTNLKNIDLAAKVFIDTIKENGKVLVYADVDADGCSSATIIYRYLKRFNIEVDTYINPGKKHGVQPEFEPSSDIDLIVIVDSINNDMEQYNRLLKEGFKIIVLDHHLISDEVLVNQHLINLVSSANEYGNPHLSGSGVCWKFVSYIDYLLGVNYALELADLAAVGIIADVCSVGPESMENRAICELGFNFIHNIGLRTLLNNKDTMCSTDIGFSVGPLINAANRMDYNELALKLFLIDKITDAKEIIKQLTKVKDDQKKLANDFFMKMQDQAESQLNKKCMWFIVPDTIGNLSGLLATKASSKWHRPCIVMHLDLEHNTYGGSMRAEGIDNFSIIINESPYNAECLGHENSAGIIIDKDCLSDLICYVENKLKDHVFSTDYKVDLMIERTQVTPFLLRKLNEFNRISGQGFSPILTLLENVTRYNTKRLSQGKHLCIEVPDMKFIIWNFNDWHNIIEIDGNLSAIGTLEESIFMGKTTIQMLMEDYCFTTISKPVSLW